MSVYRTSRKGRGGVMRERWMIDITIDRPGQTPRRIQRVARGQTEREAMREERELLAAIHGGTWRAPREPKPAPVPAVERPTFEAFAARWMKTYVATNNKPSERETKASILRVHLEVDLSEHARDALRAHRHLRSDLVFCDEAGSLIARGAVKWPLYSACKRAGLPRVGWHVLRHTFASHLVMRGQPLKTAQEILGHATIEMTMRYAHLAPESRRDAVRLLDGPGVTPALLRPAKGG